MPKIKAAIPSAHEVEQLLYIVTRHETDAAREFVLPLNEPSGKIVFAQYQKERLTLRFLPKFDAPPHRQYYRSEALFHTLAKERGWFFRWLGAAVGPARLTHQEAAAMTYHRYHNDRRSTIYTSTLVDDRLIRLADHHLYPSQP